MLVDTRKNYNTCEDLPVSSGPVLIDFWAPWCGPCRRLSPVIEELAGEYAGKLKVTKVNIDEQPNLARGFQVMSIPTLALVKNGKLLSTSVGLKTKDELEKWLRHYI